MNFPFLPNFIMVLDVLRNSYSGLRKSKDYKAEPITICIFLNNFVLEVG